jgi:hypothetical protein
MEGGMAGIHVSDYEIREVREVPSHLEEFLDRYKVVYHSQIRLLGILRPLVLFAMLGLISLLGKQRLENWMVVPVAGYMILEVLASGFLWLPGSRR